MNRTLFFALPLRGVETCAVEGLRSYIYRLAYLHSLTPGSLIKCLQDAQPKGAETIMQSESLLKMTSHGHRAASRLLMQQLQAATGVDLESSTLARFSSLLDARYLVSSKQGRYCPICIGNATNIEEQVGFLAWEIGSLDSCPIHHVLLLQPSVDCGAPIRSPKYRRPQHPGVCASCGSIGYRCQNNAAVPATPAQIWIAESVGRLVSLSSSAIAKLTPASLRQGLSKLIELRYAGNSMKASSDSGLSDLTIRSWFKGHHQQSLSHLLILCYRAEADILNLLAGSYVYRAAPKDKWLARRPHVRAKNDMKTVEKALIAAAREEDPPSLSSLVKKLGVNRGSIKAKLPNEVKALNYARKNSLARTRLAKEKSLQKKLTSVAKALVASGRKVSKGTLSQRSGIIAFKSDKAKNLIFETIVARYSNLKD